MTTQHTPGPWKACRSNEDFHGELFEPDEGDKYPITRIEAASGTVAAAHDLFKFKQADAHLIAAAPDLLALARDVLDYYQGDDLGEYEALLLGRVAAVIAKAEGRA